MDQKRLIRTGVFVVIVGGVLGTFFFLGTQEGPPDMPPGPQHKLRFTLKGDLIGVEAEPPIDPVKISAEPYDKRSVEKRINTGCTACHGKPPQFNERMACGTPAGGPCLPEHHPPKEECIKCHRMARPGAPAPPSTAPPATPSATPAADAGAAVDASALAPGNVVSDGGPAATAPAADAGAGAAAGAAGTGTAAAPAASAQPAADAGTK